jgi:hypothetical protein
VAAWGANPVRLGGDWSSGGDQKGETLSALFCVDLNHDWLFAPEMCRYDFLASRALLDVHEFVFCNKAQATYPMRLILFTVALLKQSHHVSAHACAPA